MMKSGATILLVLALAGVMSSERKADAWATWNYEMVAANETPFLGQGWWTVRHTWSDVWTQPWDSTQSWHSGTDRCGPSYGSASDCSWAYRSWAFSFHAQWWTNYQTVGWYLDHHHHQDGIAGANFIYLVNGVCHTATNRSSRKTGLARVVDYGITGSGPSQSAFGTCGKFTPWGFGISCP